MCPAGQGQRRGRVVDLDAVEDEPAWDRGPQRPRPDHRGVTGVSERPDYKPVGLGASTALIVESVTVPPDGTIPACEVSDSRSSG